MHRIRAVFVAQEMKKAPDPKPLVTIMAIDPSLGSVRFCHVAPDE